MTSLRRADVPGALLACAALALACGGSTSGFSAMGVPGGGSLLQVDLPCAGFLLALPKDPLAPCVPAGAADAAARIRVDAAGPRVVGEVGVGFGQCLVDHVDWKLDGVGACEAVFVFPETPAAFTTAGPLLPPPTVLDRVMEKVDSVLLPSGHL